MHQRVARHHQRAGDHDAHDIEMHKRVLLRVGQQLQESLANELLTLSEDKRLTQAYEMIREQVAHLS
jgi:hypothetical protein